MSEPIQAKSKSDFKRIKAQGGDVLPPAEKRLYAVTAYFKTGQCWKRDTFTEAELNAFVKEIREEGWLHFEGNKFTVYPPQSLDRIVVEPC